MGLFKGKKEIRIDHSKLAASGYSGRITMARLKACGALIEDDEIISEEKPAAPTRGAGDRRKTGYCPYCNAKKRRLRLVWTCSDHAHHEHRWRWTAWLCGRAQRILNRMPGGKGWG